MIFNVEETNLRFDLRDKYDTDEIVVKEMFEENVYEIHGWHFDDQDGVCVDIGANIGAFSIQAAHIGASLVYAVEPEPHNLEALKQNVIINKMSKKIKIIDLGVSNFNGTATISDHGGDASIKDSEDGATVNIVTLDKLFKDNKIKNVNVLKIDVEGSEPEVLLGASKETLSMCKYIAVEFDVRTGSMLGEMVMKLSETHHVRTMGSWERGGMIFANRY